jgi:hypothetical protein
MPATRQQFFATPLCKPPGPHAGSVPRTRRRYVLVLVYVDSLDRAIPDLTY